MHEINIIYYIKYDIYVLTGREYVASFPSPRDVVSLTVIVSANVT
jgi:hypothetical protein